LIQFQSARANGPTIEPATPAARKDSGKAAGAGSMIEVFVLCYSLSIEEIPGLNR
jgi:hypothetical protein